MILVMFVLTMFANFPQFLRFWIVKSEVTFSMETPFTITIWSRVLWAINHVSLYHKKSSAKYVLSMLVFPSCTQTWQVWQDYAGCVGGSSVGLNAGEVDVYSLKSAHGGAAGKHIRDHHCCVPVYWVGLVSPTWDRKTEADLGILWTKE